MVENLTTAIKCQCGQILEDFAKLSGPCKIAIRNELQAKQNQVMKDLKSGIKLKTCTGMYLHKRMD